MQRPPFEVAVVLSASVLKPKLADEGHTRATQGLTTLRMNPTQFPSTAISFSPIRSTNGTPVPNLYSLKALLPNSKESYYFRDIHLPECLLENLETANTEKPVRLNIETLDTNGPYSSALPGRPTYLLTAASTDGKEERVLPIQLRRRIRKFLLAGAIGSSVGALLLSADLLWVGTVVLTLSTHALRSAWQAPH